MQTATYDGTNTLARIVEDDQMIDVPINKISD